MNLETLDANVVRGALRADEMVPGWHNTIDEARLNIASGVDCICGQIGGNYTKGLWKLGLKRRGPDGARHGFITSHSTSGRYAELKKLWLREIELRKLKDIPAEEKTEELIAV